ncbi:MAG TPA: bifunctional DNA primase/polymerase [Acidimicrobiales bacterium]|nr:bifunctional DNA primase/polymerase [Acidimicrobiales bacterium]
MASGRRPIDAAHVYAVRGWPVFPCHTPADLPGACTCRVEGCGSPGKHPRVAGGLNAATVDPAQVDAWWSRWPIANVGIRTGADSGLVVVDVDPDHDGERSLERLAAEHGELPEGRVVRTGSGGRHLYFRHPGGLVRNDAGRKLGPGLDIRGDGGYVIAPPSLHTSGGKYIVSSGGADLPELPDWMLRMARPPEPAKAVVSNDWRPSGDTTAWAKAALEGELARLRTAQPGMRNHTLNRVAFRLGQIIAGGQLDEADVEGLLLRDALATGLGEREALATVHSGLAAGEAQPRTRTSPPRNSGVDGVDVAD